jgi:DNA-binding FrmR family transcriptional regulator
MATSETDVTYGYSENREAVLKRLRRIKGQVGGVERMVEENRYCIDVVTQVTAIHAALDKVALELLSDHAAHCVVGAKGDEQQERTEELMAAIKRLLHR